MHSQFRAWAQLVRIPNTLTACADVLAGFTLAMGAWWQISGIAASLVMASLASICLYWAGMILNDVHDFAEDIANRRSGPLVDGLISVGMASMVGWALLVIGVVLAGVSANLLPTEDKTTPFWIVAATASILASAIVAYDSSLKSTPLGPILMGFCRGLNFLVGVSLGALMKSHRELDWASIVPATIGLVLFVTGITQAARREGHPKQCARRLVKGWIISFIGLFAIAMCSLWSDRSLLLEPHSWFPILVTFLALPWLRRAFVSVQKPGVGTLVPAIKLAILSIIFIDAAIALQFGGYLPGMIVCGLAIPTFALGRIFRVT